MTDLLLAFAMKDMWTYIVLGVIILLFVLMVVAHSRRSKVAQAEYAGMLDTLRPGTKVKTVGGVIGVIKEIKEEAPSFKTVLLETGTAPHSSFVLYDIQAVYGIVDEDKMRSEAAKAEIAAIEDHKNPDDGIDAVKDVTEPQKGGRKGGKADKNAKA